MLAGLGLSAVSVSWQASPRRKHLQHWSQSRHSSAQEDKVAQTRLTKRSLCNRPPPRLGGLHSIAFLAQPEPGSALSQSDIPCTAKLLLATPRHGDSNHPCSPIGVGAFGIHHGAQTVTSFQLHWGEKVIALRSHNQAAFPLFPEVL